MPKLFDPEILRLNPAQCSYEQVLDWLADDDLSADVVLCNTVDLFDDLERHSGVMLVSRVKRVREEFLEPMSRITRQAGTDADIMWLALRTSFQIGQLVEDDPQLALLPRDNARVKRRILEQYGIFLSFREPTGEAAREVERVLAQEVVLNPDVERVLEAYTSPVDLDRYASQHQAARSAFRTRMIGD